MLKIFHGPPQKSSAPPPPFPSFYILNVQSPATGKISPFHWSKIIETSKFTYSPFKKALEKQTKKQVDALKFLNVSNKDDKFLKNESIFPKYLLNNFIINKALEIAKWQEIIKSDELDYKS